MTSARLVVRLDRVLQIVTEATDAFVSDHERRLTRVGPALDRLGRALDALEWEYESMDHWDDRDRLRRAMREVDGARVGLRRAVDAIGSYDLYDPIRTAKADLRHEPWLEGDADPPRIEWPTAAVARAALARVRARLAHTRDLVREWIHARTAPP